MRRPEVHPGRPMPLGRYALAGAMALALSLAGLLGGHHLIAAAFGTGDADEARAAPPAEAAPCPPELAAAGRCDFDGAPAASADDAGGPRPCEGKAGGDGGPHEGEVTFVNGPDVLRDAAGGER